MHKKKCETAEVEISIKDQEIIHYVAGYVIFAMTRKYQRLSENPKNYSAKDILAFLQTLKLKSSEEFHGDNFLKFVERWTNLVNRGALVRVNQDFFIFIRRIETVIRKELTISFLDAYRGENLLDHLLEKLRTNGFVVLGWEALSRSFPNAKLSEILFKQILEKWVDIRGNSYVKTFMQVLKRRLNMAAKNKGEQVFSSAEPSLRKTLF